MYENGDVIITKLLKDGKYHVTISLYGSPQLFIKPNYQYSTEYNAKRAARRVLRKLGVLTENGWIDVVCKEETRCEECYQLTIEHTKKPERLIDYSRGIG